MFRTVYIDPPWPERGAGKVKRGADRHYDLMSVGDIEALPHVTGLCATWSDDCHLWMWTTNNYLPAALQIGGSWGFRYINKITWVKGHVEPPVEEGQVPEEGDDVHLENAGLGQYVRGLSEDCLLFVRGRCEYRVLANSKRGQAPSVIVAPRPRERLGRAIHSAKPAEVRAAVERVSHEHRLEVFAREAVPGWSRWGNEAPAGDGLLVTP